MGMLTVPNVPNPKPSPLAAILRPKSLSDVVGQEHLVGPSKPLTLMVEKKRFQSTILWGPPGVGKTTIVRAMANDSGSTFHQLNATEAKVADIRKIVDDARKSDVTTFVFVDEIHCWSKSQQDVLLPNVEDGTIVLFGATTEKPKFAVNSTILSRCLVLEVKPLSQAAALSLMKRVKDYYKAKGTTVKIDKEAAARLVNRCSGDARKTVTALETIIEILSEDGTVSVEHVDVAIPEKHLVFDARGNEHFDYAHAFQEAIQNSDVDAALYWMGKWVASGEDVAYICRRMLISAFEDCAGNPYAWLAAVGACFTTERTGAPECLIPMSVAVCEMAKSKRNKSAYYAIGEVMQDVANGATIHVPPELRAGTAGYMRAVSKTYLKEWVKDWHVQSKRDPDDEPYILDRGVMYAIGEEGENGFWDGPNPSLDEMLDTPGQSTKSVIVRLVSKGGEAPTYTIVFKWDDEFGGEWVKVA
jgi:putative ATPase